MGKENLAVNQLLERKPIFADLMNGVIYGGRQVLNARKLELISVQTGIPYRDETGATHILERRGDVRMKADMGTYSVILANESQSSVHYAMPVRNMLYDALEYTKQVQELEKIHKEQGHKLTGAEFLSGIKKEDRLIPVITTVLYFGDQWDGGKSLYEMMDLGKMKGDEAILKKYLPDYPINLISASEIERPEVFTSCLQQIFTMVKYNHDKQRLYQYINDHRTALNKMDGVEKRAALILLGEQKRLAKMMEETREEDFDMCEAITQLIEDGKIKGIEEGRAIGQTEGRAEGEQYFAALTKHLIKDAREADLLRAIDDSLFREGLYKEYEIKN